MVAAACSCAFGSSPCMWGTPVSVVYVRDAIRFIPTCVGNSMILPESWEDIAVHPHMRGELFPIVTSGHSSPGSSPHAWGTLIILSLRIEIERFIPTCVGNSPRSIEEEATPPVHPHMRGELPSCSSTIRRSFGSSPHAWGTRVGALYALRAGRFIPTCVGNSNIPVVGNIYRAVHPHMRGELASWRTLVRNSIGSSPHAWGTHDRRQDRHGGCRFIPTCVGNSEPVSRS